MNRFLPLVATAIFGALLAQSAQAGLFKKSDDQTQKPSPNNPLAGNTSKQPDKQLFDKAMTAMKKGRYDVARLDLQTLLNTYPESEYQMRAKLAVGDSWFREGGTAALAQAEAEYKDFITFFPNQPEAAEAQMRVADIYFMQMEKPDRDHTNADRAEEEYRTMIQQFPDSPLVPRAKQRLREVQEVLADRQYEIGSFYASHENWSATIARLQSLTDRYPLYSHSDLALIGLGDAYAAEARYVQALPSTNFSASAKQELIKAYDDRAADAYGRVVTHYAMAPHVEDARERLIALNRPVPEPTQAELAESEAQEQSRIGVSLKTRALFLIKHGPTTVNAARIGDPTLTDPTQVNAPTVTKENQAMFSAAMAGKPIPTTATAAPAATEAAAADQNAQPAGESTTPLQLESVPSADGGGRNGPAIGASIVNQGGNSNSAPASGQAPAGGQNGAGTNATPSTNPGPAQPAPADPGAAAAAAAAGVPGAQNPGGLAPVAPANTTLPPVDKAAPAAAQTNDVHGANTAQVQTGTSTGATAKKPKEPKYNSGDESSSKHKRKKGLDKLNPF
jgi:outer membrane protein assembly factor BamD